MKTDKKVRLEERKLKDLIIGMLSDPEVQELVSPKSDEYMLIDEVNQMNLCIEASSIKVANHAYSMDIQLRMKFCEEMKKLVKDKVEVDRQQKKKTMFKNQIDLLDKLTKNYKDK